MKKRKVTLYLKSARILVGMEKWGRWTVKGAPGMRGGTRFIPDYQVYSEPKYESVLSNDQKSVVKMARELAYRYGFDLEIVDVMEENPLQRVIQEKIKSVKVFPTLITDSGDRIEGNISREQVRLLLSKMKRTA